MKRNYLYKNTGRFLLATGLLVTTLLSSCLKDNSPGVVNFGNSPSLISWQYAGFQATPYTATMLPVGSFKYNTVEVALSTSTVTLKSAVSANVTVSSADLDAYNAANGTSYTLLPSSDYTLASSVTIPAGQQKVIFPITFNAGAIDFTKNYALALELTGANGASIPSNLNIAIIKLNVKSLYEDTYNVISGNTTRYNGATVASGVRDVFTIAEPTITYLTYNASTVTGQFGSSSFGLTAAITISGTTVTVSADPNGTLGSTTFNYVNGNSSGTSSYDPATKTLIIHASYLNAAGALREVNEDLVGQ
jgi:hypothetical protein